jgi:DNA-binding MarR family transcriptional regulator
MGYRPNRFTAIYCSIENNNSTACLVSLKQPHTLSALVDRTAKRGLVKKVKDLERKNLVRVEITEKGLKAYEHSTKRGPIHRIMGELTPEERKKFRRYLEKIYAQARREIGMDLDRLPASE